MWLIVSVGIDQHDVSAVDLSIGDECVLAFDRVAALASHKTGNHVILIVSRLFLVDIHQYEVRHAEAVSVMGYGNGLVNLGLDDFHEGRILHTVEIELHHIPAGRIMVILMQAGGVHEMRVVHPQLLRLLIHELHKGFLIPGNIKRQCPRTVGTARQKVAVDMIQRRRFVSDHKPGTVCLRFDQPFHHLPGKFDDHVLGIGNLLDRDDRSHDLCHACRIHLLFGADIENHLSIVRIDHIDIVTPEIGKVGRPVGFGPVFGDIFSVFPAAHKKQSQQRKKKQFLYDFHKKNYTLCIDETGDGV